MSHGQSSANDALQRLLDGNRRYVLSNVSHPNQSALRRLTLATAQQPLAVILGCADSRVPPEIIFDQGLGDLVVVRVAGNIVCAEVLGSIEFAVEHLGTRLIVVLGHQSCAAVKLALAGGEAPGHLESVVRTIRPATERARRQFGDELELAVNANVRYSVEQLSTAEPVLGPRVRAGELTLVGMRYALTTGLVDVLD